jgi:hypothetical protein
LSAKLLNGGGKPKSGDIRCMDFPAATSASSSALITLKSRDEWPSKSQARRQNDFFDSIEP